MAIPNRPIGLLIPNGPHDHFSNNLITAVAFEQEATKPTAASPPNRHRAFIVALSFVLLLAPGCGQKAERSDGVQLVLNTEEIHPNSTFELRFDEPMALSSMIGAEAKTSPLVFSPDVPGRFVYTSARSGLFTLAEPLPLGTEYELSLRPGLRRTDGQPAKADLLRRIRTPPFGVVNCQGNDPSTNASSMSQIRLWFNADVKASDIAFHTSFANAQGLWVPALVQQVVVDDHHDDWSNGLRTWEELSEEQQHQAELNSPRTASTNAEPINEISTLLIVTPAQPLSVGSGWKLVLEPRLSSANGRLHTDKRSEAEIGDVIPFALRTNSIHHVINSEPRLQLDFSKRVHHNLTNSFTNWVQISPSPTDLKAEAYGSTLSLSGEWQRGTNYSVTLRRGLPAEDGSGLALPKVLAVEIPPIDPRLYFAAFSTEQLAGGIRAFPLLAINVSRIRVRAKLVDSTTAIHALRGYSSYLPGRPGVYIQGQDFERLDYNLIPGRTVFSEEILGASQEDSAQEIKLDWDSVLNGRRTGIVFLEAERISSTAEGEPVLGTQALIQLTDLGLVWKSGGTQVRVFVFSYGTGQPMPGARVKLYSEENEPLREATTDGSGLASLNTHTNAVWLMAQVADDLHAIKLHDHNILPSSYRVPVRWDSSERDREGDSEEDSEGDDAPRVALFTDRDVYRPGETVNLKAIVRQLTEAGLTIPSGITGKLTCADSRGREFFETNLVLSAMGSCAAAIPLPSGPRGSYEIHLRVAGRDNSHAITVADYQPAAFAIVLRPKPAYLPDEPVSLPVSAQYFFGKSLNRARVHWSLEAADHPPKPKAFEPFTFVRTELESQWGRGSGAFAASGDGQITEGGNCVITADVPLNPTAPQPRAISLLVEVTDLNQQTITRSVDFLKQSSEFYLGFRRFEDVLEVGKALPIEIAAVSAGETPWREPVHTHISLQRVVWQTVRVQGVGRTARYMSEATLTNVLERDVVVPPPVKLPGIEGAFTGSFVEGISAPSAGEYVLEVKAQDAAGHEVASSINFDVTDKAQMAWNYRNEVQIKLVPDKPLYRPGDTALILVKTPISGTAWVTVECDKVLRSFATQLEGNAPAVRVPIEATDLPNVFVFVTLVRGAEASPHKTKEPEYRVGYCQLNVEDPNTRLRVEVTPGATNYLPGEIVKAEARIANASGEPVPEAEVTLYAVDEGVLTLTDYAVPDLHSVLFAQRELVVNSGISLPFLLSEDPDQLTFQNKGYSIGGGGGYERMRQHFVACAYWNATLRSDADGGVTAEFTAPDSMTRYRLIAVAHTAASQFGSGHSGFTVSKPLIVEPALPRFANITDRIQARAVVLNQTDLAGDVLVTLQLDDKARALELSTLSQKIHVAAHGSAVMEVPVALLETGTATWNWWARFADTTVSPFSDGVRSTLAVGNLMPLLREIALVRVAAGETNLLAGINPQVLSGQGTINVTVANTRVVSLGEAASELLHYPYGCAEQTGSSLLPWVLLKETPELIPFTGRTIDEATDAAKAGIRRLFSMQTPSGGLSYWPGEREPMLWASAYGGFVLALARAAGLPVPEGGYRTLLDYLSRQLRDEPASPTASGDRCLAVYALALAGKAEPAYHETLFEQRARLSPESRALLALAIATSGGDSHMTDELLRTNSPSAHIDLDTFACPAREKAIRLLALLACRPNDAEAQMLFTQLEQDQRHAHWDTTQGNAWALLAVRDYLRKAESAPDASAGTLTWHGQSTPFQLASMHGVFTQTFPLTPEDVNKPLLLAASSGKPLFAQVTVEARSQATNQVREDHGLSLQRRYERLNDENEPQRFDTLRVGDRILVTLRLKVHESAAYGFGAQTREVA